MRALQFTGTATMRLLSFLLLCGLSLSAFAANLEPLPAPPAFTPEPETSSDEPEVTIIKQTELTVEEYRSGGRLYMIKVTPKVGPPYYMVDQRGDGKFARQESLDTGFRPPQWVIHRF
jgi:hypothetical protein